MVKDSELKCEGLVLVLCNRFSIIVIIVMAKVKYKPLRVMSAVVQNKNELLMNFSFLLRKEHQTGTKNILKMQLMNM